MADQDLVWLKDRFRSAVDDLDIDPTDQSGLLWSDDDVLEYIDAAHAQFIHDTLYKHETLELVVVANDPIVPLPTKVIELRGTAAYLVSTGTPVYEINSGELGAGSDDYGFDVAINPYADQTPGTPRSFSADIEADELRLFPPSATDDVLQVPAYVEGRPIEDWRTALDIKLRRHIRMLLNGVRALAYGKQDADTLDPSQAQRWQEAFERDIEQVASERRRRARRPQTMRYGGL